MKLAHLSDLHLGKRVNEFSMTEDQRYILKKITEIIRQEQVQGVLIAGDVYDKTVPSAEAVELLDEFLTGLSRLGVPVFLISGNHDSAERLAFGARLMAGSRIYISPVYNGKIAPVMLEDEYGEAAVWLLPFLKPATVRSALEGRRCEEMQEAAAVTAEAARPASADEPARLAGEDATAAAAAETGSADEAAAETEKPVSAYQTALQAAVDLLEVDTAKRNILVAHQFVTGAGRCDSEEVSVGGLDSVDASVFAPFDYVALGHIHGPQSIGRETLRYCGTPLKYSFSEASHQKSVTIVELREKGEVQVKAVPLVPLRDMRKLRGTYMEVTARSFYENQNTRDYLQITLTDEEDVPNAMEKLRTIYPNLMRLEYDNRRTRSNRSVEAASEEPEKSELELFEEFYRTQNNADLSEVQRSFVEGLIQRQKEGMA